MASLRRTIARGMMFKNMNAKQKKLRRAERKNARKNPRAEVKRRTNIISQLEQEV